MRFHREDVPKDHIVSRLNVKANDFELNANTGIGLSPQVELPAPVVVQRPTSVVHIDAESFEWLCAEWCVYFGNKNVTVTQATRDGGVDIIGDGFVAQVKFQELPVGVRPIRELAGVMTARGVKVAYFFTVNGYTKSALGEAEELSLAAFLVSPLNGQISAATSMAELILEDADLTFSPFPAKED
jgi:hypothetical protein